jgi:hypothetical protein
MKPYVEFYDWYIVLLEGLYFLGFSSIVWMFSGRLLLDKSAQFLSICAFAVFIIFSKVAAFLPWFPYFPDTQGFAMLVEGGNYINNALGIKLYYIVSSPLRWVSFEQLELYLITQQFLFVLSIILVWKSWLIHSDACNYKPGRYGLFVLLMILYPSILMFVTTPLREFLMVFGFSLFLYGTAQYLHMKRIKWLIIGSLLTIFIRPQLVVLYPLMLVVATQKNYVKLFVFGSLLLISLAPVFEWVTGYEFSPEFFAFLRERGTSHYAASGMTYGSVVWHSYLDVLIDLPLLTSQFLLSPLPIMHTANPLNFTVMLVDLFFVLFVYWGVFRIKVSVSAPYIKMFFLASIVFSVWEFYIGGAVRHRMPLVIMLLPLAACFYSSVAEKVVRKVKIN